MQRSATDQQCHPGELQEKEEEPASMRQWKTKMVLVHESGVLETGPISIKRGIFQGDSLSPPLFTMSLNPLSWELQKTGYGYQLDKQNKINHLFYVDDLKLYGTSDSQLNGLISTVKKVSDDIQMEFGLEKCPKATFKRGKKSINARNRIAAINTLALSLP